MANEIRLAPESLEDRHDAGMELCEHVALPNAYAEEQDAYEYGQSLTVRCNECDTEYQFLVKVN